MSKNYSYIFKSQIWLIILLFLVSGCSLYAQKSGFSNDKLLKSTLFVGGGSTFGGSAGFKLEIKDPGEFLGLYASGGLRIPKKVGLKTVDHSFNYSMGCKFYLKKLGNGWKITGAVNYGWIENYYYYEIGTDAYDFSVFGTSASAGFEYRASRKYFVEFNVTYVLAVKDIESHPYYSDVRRKVLFSVGIGRDLSMFTEKCFLRKDKLRKKKEREEVLIEKDKEVMEEVVVLDSINDESDKEFVIIEENYIEKHENCLFPEGIPAIKQDVIKGGCEGLALYRQVNIDQFIFVVIPPDSLGAMKTCEKYNIEDTNSFISVFMINTSEIAEHFCCFHTISDMPNSNDMKKYVAEKGMVSVAISGEQRNEDGFGLGSVSVKLTNTFFIDNSSELKDEIYFDDIIIWNVSNYSICGEQ